MSDYKEQCWKRYMENKKYERYDKEDLIDEIIEMQVEIEKLNNIINKAREYIEDRYDGEVLTHTFDKDNVGELLEILKGSEKE